jgi:hypothetical protein
MKQARQEKRSQVQVAILRARAVSAKQVLFPTAGLGKTTTQVQLSLTEQGYSVVPENVRGNPYLRIGWK